MVLMKLAVPPFDPPLSAFFWLAFFRPIPAFLGGFYSLFSPPFCIEQPAEKLSRRLRPLKACRMLSHASREGEILGGH